MSCDAKGPGIEFIIVLRLKIRCTSAAFAAPCKVRSPKKESLQECVAHMFSCNWTAWIVEIWRSINKDMVNRKNRKQYLKKIPSINSAKEEGQQTNTKAKKKNNMKNTRKKNTEKTQNNSNQQSRSLASQHLITLT